MFGRLALKMEPPVFCTLEGRGKRILESCICFTRGRRVLIAATGSTRMIWGTGGNHVKNSGLEIDPALTSGANRYNNVHFFQRTSVSVVKEW